MCVLCEATDCVLVVFCNYQDVKFPLMLDVYELCTSELQEKMVTIRSKFKEVEDKKLENQPLKAGVLTFVSSVHLSFSTMNL